MLAFYQDVIYVRHWHSDVKKMSASSLWCCEAAENYRRAEKLTAVPENASLCHRLQTGSWDLQSQCPRLCLEPVPSLVSESPPYWAKVPCDNQQVEVLGTICGSGFTDNMKHCEVSPPPPIFLRCLKWFFMASG